MSVIESLWGAEFNVDDTLEKTKKILNKIKSPHEIAEMPVEKVIQSKSIPFIDKLKVISDNVRKILGDYADETICIYTREDFHNYVTASIKNGIISIDTETIGTRTDIDKPGTDPLTAKICGLCLYTPGQKNAYIPINHTDPETRERLESQLTEKDIYEEMSRVVSSETFTVYQNGKFDYMVIYYTCGIKVPICWDTMIGSQLLNENEPAGLKFQYRDKINPDQEKYDLDKLFDLDKLDMYPPELFALYAATDPNITYKLFEYQKSEFEKPGCEKLYNLFRNIEMPVVTATAEMEMRGIAIDTEFAGRLSNKFHIRLDRVDKEIEEEMLKYKPIIDEWRNTPAANSHPEINGKKQKSLNEKLSDPIEVTSATQLGILLYDILRVLKSKDGKKVVDEATLETLSLPLTKLILEKREYEKYLGTYIDKLPLVKNPRDDRVHAHFNQMGREDRNVVTGRMSSSDPNLQNIPSRGDITSVRCMFVPTTEYHDFESNNNVYEVPIENEVLLSDNTYKWSSELKQGDILNTGETVDKVEIENKSVFIFIKQ